MKRHIITALCVLVAYCAWGQLTHRTQFPSVSQMTYQVVGDSCVELHLGNVEMTSHPEQPELPIAYYTFIIPTHSKVAAIEPVGRTVVNRNIPLPIKCSPTAETANGEVVRSNTTDEVPQYLTSELYLASDGYFDGDIHLITVAYSPITYVRGTQTYSFATIPQFRVVLQNGHPEGLTPITPLNRNNNARIVMIQSMVDNPENVASFIPTAPNISPDSLLLGGSSPLPCMGYEYLVITTSELYDTTQKLIDWKRSKGIHAGVVRYEDIRDINVSDTLTNYAEIDDEAGNLRKYLRHAYANGLKYLFLVSERGVIPYRNAYNRDHEKNAIPTDFYYAELNQSWSTNEYGGYNYPSSDLTAELAVGRLFVSDNEEWSSYIDRLITYERNPGHGNPDYLGKYFTIQSDQMQMYNSGHAAAEILSSCFSNIQTWNEEPGYNAPTTAPIRPSGKEVIDELQNNPCGYFATYAHGGQMFTSTYTGGLDDKTRHAWVIRSVENDTITNGWKFLTNQEETALEPGAGIDRINLPQNPFMVYSISCTTMPYDTVMNLDINKGSIYNPNTIGIAFTAKSKSAVAYLGNTRSGYITFSPILHNCFNQTILDGITNIGLAENISKFIYDSEFYKTYLALTHNILGCPEIPMWTNIPQKMTEVTSSDTVCVTPLFSNNAPRTMLYGEVTSHALYNQNHSVAKIRQNFYPYYMPIELQNVTLQSTHTIFGGDIEMGHSVKANTTKGDFEIGTEGYLTIETTGTVSLSYGTIIRTGGSLTIKHVKQ